MCVSERIHFLTRGRATAVLGIVMNKHVSGNSEWILFNVPCGGHWDLKIKIYGRKFIRKMWFFTNSCLNLWKERFIYLKSSYISWVSCRFQTILIALHKHLNKISKKMRTVYISSQARASYSSFEIESKVITE